MSMRRPTPAAKESGALIFMIVALVVAGGLGFYFLSERSADRRADELRSELRERESRQRDSQEWQRKKVEKDLEEENRLRSERQARDDYQDYLQKAAKHIDQPLK